MATKRIKNVQAGFWDAAGFHPLRRSVDYDADRAGDDYGSNKDNIGPAFLKGKKKSAAKKKGKKKSTPRKRNSPFVNAKVRRLANGDIQIFVPVK